MVLSQKTGFLLHRIKYIVRHKSITFINSCKTQAYVNKNLKISTIVTILSPFCTISALLFHLIQIIRITINLCMRKTWVYKRKGIKGWWVGWYESGKRKMKALPTKALAEHFRKIKYTQLNSDVFTGTVAVDW